MMDGELLKVESYEKLPIPTALLAATLNTIKAGIKLDESELKRAAATREAEEKKKKKSKQKKWAKRFAVGPPPTATAPGTGEQRTYRALNDRRFGLFIIGDQQRFLGKKTEKSIFPEAPPLDYSFCLLTLIEEIVSQHEPPNLRRNHKQPVKSDDDKYITSSLRLSYNVLTNFEGFVNTLYKILEPGPFGLCWLDLSFNSIDVMDEDTFSQLPNLKILYLHGNRIADMLEVQKLMTLSSLRTLTLHGNPIELETAYRVSVLYYLPNLKSLDYFGVTKSDKATSAQLGSSYQNHWERRHVELLARAKKLKEVMGTSLTTRLMNEDVDYKDE